LACCRTRSRSARVADLVRLPCLMRPEKAKPSVCWYAPLQLLRTARLVAIATIFGQHADPRLVEAISRMMGANEARWALRHSDRTTTATTQLPFGSTTSATPVTGGTRPTRSPTMRRRMNSRSSAAIGARLSQRTRTQSTQRWKRACHGFGSSFLVARSLSAGKTHVTVKSATAKSWH